MNNRILLIFVAAAALAMPAFSGCDREVSRSSQTKVRNGEVQTKETVIKETPEGGLIKEKTETERKVVDDLD